VKYLPIGGIFILKYSLIKKYYSYYSDNTYAYIMPAERSAEIDTENDFEYIEYLLFKKTKKNCD
jgi:N-acylneuraminate cytidylyltransferase/CMP-N,N'-diacetyllegionaminic acid synthase